MKKLPKNIKIYLVILDIFLFSQIYLMLVNKKFYMPTSILNIIIFSSLVVLSESFAVLYKRITFSIGFVITFATFILFSPVNAFIIFFIGYSFRVMKSNNKYFHILNTPFYGTMFNYCALGTPIIVGSFIYYFIGGTFPVTLVSANLFPLVGFCLSYLFTNLIIVSIFYSLKMKVKFIYPFLNNLKLQILNIIVMAPFGVILVIIFKSYKYLGLFLAFCPILLVRYTYSLYIKSKSQYLQMVDVLMQAIDARDKYTEGHSQRVAKLAVAVAKEMKLNDWKIETLNIAGLLHDVGKIGIDDAILNKPNKLTEEEYALIKKHPEIGYNIIKKIKDSEKISYLIKHHHERYIGGGYPTGKDYKELSIEVFIIQLADSVDAMASDRPYRKALTLDEVVCEVKRNSGTQFHPDVVNAYVKLVNKTNSIYGG